jgi:hypothetical protein
MKLYAETPRYRARQLLADAATVIWIVIWVRIGFFMRDLVDRLAGPGETVENAGRSFSGTVDSFGSNLDDLPVLGDLLQRPFENIASAGRTLQEAGVSQQNAVHRLAFWLGLLIALIPIGYVLLKYVPGRLRWMREAGAASSLRIDSEDFELFAIRALANQPLYELRRASDDPAAAFAARDFEPLAALELGQLGLKTRPRKLFKS